ncbi:MmpS family transport accessory protein [Cystobacter ferrugineus]|uniref:Lipoprotein n=1 Tax=Cystobacter ferrugineus TaxID=83449 RepID=A0A1L9BC73_9BACT|nr:MmpS family transport accessory protein [Cystobacter ferrugineus]OJH39854.1 hypothetical protein BON30_12210 [Cystobacter ferrugineus]
MDSRSFARTFLAVVGVALASCGDPASEQIAPLDCIMDTGTSQIPTLIPAPAGYSVKYEVTGSGAGTITKIIYRDGTSTPVVVENPVLPWTETVILYPDMDVGIGMEGSVSNGRFEMKYNGTLNSSSGGSIGAKVSGNKVCEQQLRSSTTVD